MSCTCYCFDPITFANDPTCTCGHREHKGTCPSPSISQPQNTVIKSVETPADLGRRLEDIIHAAALKIPGLTRALKELEIRTAFGDSSLNGVDHMISVGSTHILLQDKWKETTTQQEVSQFITCAERIQARLPGMDSKAIHNKVYLIWVSKREPTANSAKMLRERNVSLVCCSISLEALARCAILQICECIPISPITPLLSIETNEKPVPMAPSRHEPVIVPAPVPASVLTFDDTAEGKREIDALKQFITSIRNGVLQRAETAMRMDGIADIYTLWTSAIPKSLDDWWNGSSSKVDFNAYLKTIKNICWPLPRKQLPFRNLCYYTKLRKLSVDLRPLAIDYETRRKGLLAKKSAWAKGLPVLKAEAEPITDAEFRGAVKNTMEYRQDMRPHATAHLESAFHTHQCTAY